MDANTVIQAISFLSTLSLRRATFDRDQQNGDRPDFYPRSPCGERPARPVLMMTGPEHFYPRSPCGERLLMSSRATRISVFLSTLSLRRATAKLSAEQQARTISIHALLAESDLPATGGPLPTATFLSTLSLRRATSRHISGRAARPDFYPRSPCGERPITDIDFRIIAKISIHALLAESDVRSAGACARDGDFYPRSPCGERPRSCPVWSRRPYFYPRSPCGERLWLSILTPQTVTFLSTLSLRRAT